MRLEDVGRAGLVGWRGRVGDRVASSLGSRTRLDPDLVRTWVGLLFLGLSAYYLVRSVGEVRRRLA